MFALEIDFHDGVSPAEMLLVRRPHAIVGAGESAHVVIEGVTSSFCDVRITRELGRQFRCQPLRKNSGASLVLPLLEGVYPGEAELNLGDVTTHVTALDVDLTIFPDESLDHAALRILHRSLARPIPIFPAIVVLGSVPMFISFPEDQTVTIGRSRKCGLRLDSSGISSEHATLGCERGAFWIEDLGSTNGTFIGGVRISGVQMLGKEETVVIGGEFVLAGVASAEDVLALKERKISFPHLAPAREVFPCIVSTSSLVRPNRIPLIQDTKLHIGRDPASDIWVGSPHISRNHLDVLLCKDGHVEVVDTSSNGTFIDGARLTRNTPQDLPRTLTTIDLMQGVTLGVCYSQEDEQLFHDLFQREEEHGDSRGQKRIDKPSFATTTHQRENSLEPGDRALQSRIPDEEEMSSNGSNDSFTSFASRLKRQSAGEGRYGDAQAVSAKNLSLGKIDDHRSLQEERTLVESSRKGHFLKVIFIVCLLCLALILLAILLPFSEVFPQLDLRKSL